MQTYFKHGNIAKSEINYKVLKFWAKTNKMINAQICKLSNKKEF